MDMQGYSKENNGYKYICVIIDFFTKFVWIKPLKSKTAAHVVKALSLLLMTGRPNLLQADQGTEFFNKDFSKMLEAFLLPIFWEAKYNLIRITISYVF